MAQLVPRWVELFEVVEHGVIPRGRVCHGVFSTPEEAERRYTELLGQQPQLATPGVLWVASRRVEVFEPVGATSTAEEVSE